MGRRARRRSHLIFVLGGASSGKSQVAIDLAGKTRRRAFVATGQALDGEMKQRIARHRASRPASWTTAEVPVKLAEWLDREGSKYQSIVVDCLTLWLSNIGLATEARCTRNVAELLRTMRKVPARVVMVSNELGMGLVPVGRSVRRFRDLAGKVNQLVAAEADEVYVVVSGQKLRLK